MIFNVSTCILAGEHNSNLSNGHCHEIPSRRCCGEHRRRSRVITTGNRWQCSKLRCGWSEETESSTEKERPRQSSSFLLSISLTSESANTTLTLTQNPSQLLFFFASRVTKTKKFPHGLIDRSWHAWNFDTSNPSWLEHRRMRHGHPLFYYSTTPWCEAELEPHKLAWKRPHLASLNSVIKVHLTVEGSRYSLACVMANFVSSFPGSTYALVMGSTWMAKQRCCEGYIFHKHARPCKHTRERERERERERSLLLFATRNLFRLCKERGFTSDGIHSWVDDGTLSGSWGCYIAWRPSYCGTEHDLI